MAVSPDLLLNIKAPATAAKPPGAPPKPDAQASRDGASSFANVYARERQAKPAERSEPNAKPSRDKPVNEKASQETAKAGGSQQPTATEPGKELPADGMAATASEAEADELGEESELDPLLLLGMGGPVDLATDPLTGQLPVGSEYLMGLAQTQPAADELEAETQGDSEGESEEFLLGQRPPTAPLTVAEKSLAEQQSGKASSASVVDEPLALAIKATDVEGTKGEDVALDEDFGALLEQLGSKESPGTAPDTSVNRVNSLTQAIAQQVQQAPRPTLVPGQPVQIQQPGWSEAVVDRVMWLSSQNLKSAEIQLNPAELGRMEVRIEMNQDQTQVTFVSPHATVREALEGQMHRLREMFAQQGMAMDANVSDQSQARGSQGQGSESRGNGGRDGGGGVEDDAVGGSIDIGSSRTSGNRGLVDYYA